MVEVTLTEAEISRAEELAKLMDGERIKERNKHSYELQLESGFLAKRNSQCAWIAFHRLVNKNYDPIVKPSDDSSVSLKEISTFLNCRISTVTKDYGDIRILRHWEDDVFIVSSVIEGNKVKFLRYVKAGEGKNSDYLAPYMPSKCYLAPESITHPIEELIAILKGDTVETQ